MYRFFSSVKKKNIIGITNKAWDKMKSITNNNNKFFFISAKSGGCNGFNYDLSLKDLDLLKKYIKDDSKIPLNIIENENTKILVDPSAEFLLAGTTIDFVSEDLDKGIFENKFTFTPDKKKNTSCGCGISFSPKKN